MKFIALLVIFVGLIGGAFYLGYSSETSEEDKAYARELMSSRSGSAGGGRSVGAFEGQ